MTKNLQNLTLSVALWLNTEIQLPSDHNPNKQITFPFHFILITGLLLFFGSQL